MRLHVTAITWSFSGLLTRLDVQDKIKIWCSLNTILGWPQRWYGCFGKEKHFSPARNRTTMSRLPS